MPGMNMVILEGRLGGDVEIRQMMSGGRVATMSLATDEGYRDKNTGQWVDRAEWHRIVTFQEGLIDVLQKHAVKGRLTSVVGKLQTRRWRKQGEDADRFGTEIIITPGGQVNFLEPLDARIGDHTGSGAESHGDYQPNGAADANGSAAGSADLDDEIPF